MNIEHVAGSPGQQTPEMRYASLHRSVESGLACDKTWYDMVLVCLELGRHPEAHRAMECIQEPALAARAHVAMKRAGAISGEDSTHGSSHTGSGGIHRAVSGSGSQQAVEGDRGFKAEISDSLGFLFQDHMPLTVAVATVTFPIVIGLGGFLTQGSQSFVLPLIALIPALSVIGLVGALARRIMMEASRGIDDAPALPGLLELRREAGRFLIDGTVLSAIFLAPGVVLSQLQIEQLHPASWMAVLAIGAYLLPMAMVVRQTSSDWRALSPRTLFPAVIAGGTDYIMAVGVAAGLFAPAVLSFFATFGSQPYLQISVIGPLLVAPLFLSARLLGCVLNRRRHSFRGLVELPQRNKRSVSVREALNERREEQAAAARETAKAPASPAPQPQAQAPNPAKRRARLRTENHHPEAKARPRSQPKSKPALPAADSPARARMPERPQEAPTAAQSPAPYQDAPESGTLSLAGISASHPVKDSTAIVGEAPPDLTNMPGFNVVRGEDREKAGAASRSPRSR